MHRGTPGIPVLAGGQFQVIHGRVPDGQAHERVGRRARELRLYLWHPGTGENPWHAIRGQRNEQTLVTGGAEPSHLSITVLADA